MVYDEGKVDDMTLALMWLVMSDGKSGCRAWKSFDWATMDRLFEKGYISDPKGKARSVGVSAEGRSRAEELFAQHFGKGPDEEAS